MNENGMIPDVRALTDDWAGESGYYDFRQVVLAHPRFIHLFMEEARALKRAHDYMEHKGRSAVTYFIQQGEGGPIKIGASRNFAKRLRTLSTGSPIPLTVLGVVPGGFKLEADLHDELSAHRLEGEWFAPSDEVLQVLARHTLNRSRSSRI